MDANSRPPSANDSAAPHARATFAAESLMQAIVATATEGIVSIAVDGTIATTNRALERMFGYGPDELLGKNVTDLMPSPFREEHETYVRRYLETGKPRIIGVGREVTGRRKDGSEFPIDLSVGEGVVGERRFFVAIVRDISERKDLQAKLALAERLTAIGELAAGVAHEINNPIATILNCAQLILDGDDARESAQIVAAEAQRVAAIVRDLLRFARDDRDPPTAVSLSDVVHATIRLLRENLHSHNIRLEVQVAPDLPPVIARTPQLQQVLLNLLINAKDALAMARTAAPRIALTATADHGGVLLRIEDNGPGVPPQLGQRVFEPFVTTKRGRGGTGLGLSISKSIVEGMGGSITLREPDGHGAEFRVWMPIRGLA